MAHGKDMFMIYKVIGSILIVFACGGFGCSLAVAHKKEVTALRCLISSISFMQCELECRRTPLPELFRKASAVCHGNLARFYENLAKEMESQVCPDTKSCFLQSITKVKSLPATVTACITHMADTLGSFDLAGQQNGLLEAANEAKRCLEKLTFDQELRIRNYQTLGLCAGAAIAIILV